MTDVYFSFLPERCGAANDACYNNHLAVAWDAGHHGYHLIQQNYMRTDAARNYLAEQFMDITKRDNDLLVMMDTDHTYPINIVDQFVNEEPALGVVGALAFRRSQPYDPLWFVRHNGVLSNGVDFPIGEVIPCDIVSTSSISIRHWVFLELLQKGYTAPWFRYEYPRESEAISEDMYFGYICERAQIRHHVDTRIIIPHAFHGFVGLEEHKAYWDSYKKAHPEMNEKVDI